MLSSDVRVLGALGLVLLLGGCKDAVVTNRDAALQSELVRLGEGVDAVWLLLQHSPDSAWQRSMLPALERAAAARDISPANVAMLTDRVLVRSGQPQRYGSSFSIVDGRLVADPIEDETNVDVRRAASGLPSMAEYARRLSEAYSMPVEWPRRRK